MANDPDRYKDQNNPNNNNNKNNRKKDQNKHEICKYYHPKKKQQQQYYTDNKENEDLYDPNTEFKESDLHERVLKNLQYFKVQAIFN